MPSNTWGLVVASGREAKLGPEIDLAFLNLGSKPVLSYTLAAFEQCAEVQAVAVVVPKERLESVRVMAQLLGFVKVRRIVAGTAQRATSVLAGLREIDEEAPVVCVHDPARPGVTPAIIGEVVRAARKLGAAAAATRIGDAVKLSAKGGKVTECPDPELVWAAQSPQAFQRALILKAYEAACRKKLALADDSEAVTRAGKDVFLVPLERPLMRIASVADLAAGEYLLR